MTNEGKIRDEKLQYNINKALEKQAEKKGWWLKFPKLF